MEFKSLKNIQSSFKAIRFFCIVYIIACLGIVIYSVYSSYAFAEEQRKKIYILDEGKTLMLALSQDLATNRPVEARAHVKRFHELFFSLSPDKLAIEDNIKRALFLADKSVYTYSKDLSEKGYYNKIISAGINQFIQVDSLQCNFEKYPYEIITYARQRIIRTSNITERTLVTRCNLINTIRSDNNPQGFCIEKFEVLENKNIQIIER